MRIVYLDIDTLRPDHMGCYGYLRNTTPNLDRIAAQGVRFDKCYVSDAPCLPSRASMFTGQFGIHTGVVGHGGTAADPRLIGAQREFATHNQRPGFIQQLRTLGYRTVSFSPFAERHSAWWFCANWREMYNSGKRGSERADEIVPGALEWIDRCGHEDNWMLHINIWDPHTDYDAPEAFGNPFENEPIEDWYTEELRLKQWNGFGPGGPQEPCGSMGRRSGLPRMPGQVCSMADYKKFIDGYDCGIRYADLWCGRVLEALEKRGVLDDTLVIITSDHGENMGELAVIGDHATADHITSRVPMIVRFPASAKARPGQKAGRVDDALHYQTDLAATIIELLGGQVPAHWDGQSFAEAFREDRSDGREYVVVSNCAWSCQRSVRWGDYLLIRSYHTGLKDYPRRMLFNVAADPHELVDLAEKHPDLADHGEALLERWTSEMMATSDSDIDPLWTVMREGGPYHTRGAAREQYIQRLRDTGRGRHAAFLEAHPTGLAE